MWKIGICLLLCLSLQLLQLIFSYDSSIQFSPNGRVLQVDFAKDAVLRGSSIMGLKCTDGILLVAAKKRNKSKLKLQKTPKIFFINKHICILATGLLFDANLLVDICRKLASNYQGVYRAAVPPEKLVSDLSQILHRSTRKGYNRPFGAGLLVAGYDFSLSLFQLYRTDPEGSYDSWNMVCEGGERERESISRSLLSFHSSLSPSPSLSLTETWMKLQPILLSHFSSSSSHTHTLSLSSGIQPSSLEREREREREHERADKKEEREREEREREMDWELEVCTGMISSDGECTWSTFSLYI